VGGGERGGRQVIPFSRVEYPYSVALGGEKMG